MTRHGWQGLYRLKVPEGVWLIGEPTPVPGTDRMRCLASVGGCLVLVELRIRFTGEVL